MRSLFLVLSVLTGLCLAADIETDESVLVLTEDNFEDALADNPHILVEFYAPWCGHCKALAPEYAKAAGQLEEEESAIKLAKVDATEETELAQKFGVRGYPTIKFFKNGTPIDYTGGRTAPEIITWLNKKTGPPAQSLNTPEEATAFLDKEDVVVIGFFEDAESDNAKAYINAADSQDSIMFGISTAPEVAEDIGATQDSVIVFKKFDDGRAVYTGDFTAEEIVNFVLTEQLPLVTKFSDQTAPKIFGGNIKSHLLAFFPGGEGDEVEATLAELKTTAKDFKGKILFVHIDTSEDDAARITEFFNLEDEDIPTSRLINLDDDMRKYVPESNELTAENLRPWLTAYLEGNLQAHLNSEEIPEDWDASPVKVLVGKNFEAVALDPEKHVFVEFYAPWCGHCKQLAPIWDQLGEHFQDDEDVVIAKMDATKNEVEAVQVQGFPTLRFFRKETNEVLEYNGGRTLDDLIEYVERQVSGEAEEEEEEEEEEGIEPAKDEL